MRLCISTFLLVDDRIGFDLSCPPSIAKRARPDCKQGRSVQQQEKVTVTRFVGLEYLICPVVRSIVFQNLEVGRFLLFVLISIPCAASFVQPLSFDLYTRLLGILVPCCHPLAVFSVFRSSRNAFQQSGFGLFGSRSFVDRSSWRYSWSSKGLWQKISPEWNHESSYRSKQSPSSCLRYS